MKDKFYILRGKRAVPITLHEWAASPFKHRIIHQTTLGGVLVSTVFLGLDHQLGEGPPLLFETMVFNGPGHEYQERYSTWDEAEAGHNEVVKILHAKQWRMVE